MRHSILVISLCTILLLTACAKTQPIGQPDGPQIELAANDSAASPESDEASPSVMPALNGTSGTRDPSADLPEPEETQDAPAAAETLSFTEQAERDFLTPGREYAYRVKAEGFGEVWVINFKDKVKYTSPEQLFEVQNGTVVPSPYKLEMYEDLFLDDIRRRELHVMDYITYEDGRYWGCYVRAGTYRRDNCIPDNTSKEIIHENLSFTPPQTPIDWLRKYHGQEPLKVQENYTDKEENLVRIVDIAHFQNDDGTVTRLYIQKKFRVPVKVEIYKDNRPIETTRFKYLETDMTYLRKWRPHFFDD